MEKIKKEIIDRIKAIDIDATKEEESNEALIECSESDMAHEEKTFEKIAQAVRFCYPKQAESLVKRYDADPDSTVKAIAAFIDIMDSIASI